MTRHCPKCNRKLPEDWKYAVCYTCGKEPCPHGNQPAECNDCMTQSDFAYDAWRENR